MANQGPPPGAIMECLWDKDGKFAIKEDDWECSGCSSYNDNKEEVNGKLEQLYKCATCDQTRPGFANIRKKKEAEARKANPEDGLTGFQISFGGDTAVAGSSPAIDIFGGGSVGKSKKSSPAAAGSAPALDLFGNGGAAKAEAPALNLFGSPAPATGPAVVVSFGATDPAAPAPAAGLDLFGAGSSASAPSSDAKAGGASLNVGELLAFAGSSPSKTSPAKPRKRKAEGGGAAKKTRRSEPAAEDAGAAPANVEFVRPADRNASAAAGHLFSWGSGECDQLGHGKVLEDDEGLMDLEVHRPRQISDVKDHDFVFICCGGLHTAALERSGVVYTWGCNDDKALGRVVDQKQALLDFYAKADPKKEEAAISKIFDKYHAAGRVDDLFAKLGKKYGFFPVDESVPGPVTTISEPVVQVECGNSHTVALTESGRVILWGCYKDASGQLGFDSEGTDTQVLPREVPGLFKAYGKVVQVASGGDHTLALTEKGVVIAWGDAEQGQVARKVPSRHKQQGLRLHPVSFPKGVKVKSIFAGGFCSFAVTESGEAFSWGLNNYGQLGCGDHESRFAVTPLSIPGEEIVQVASGIHHTLILTRAGRVFGAGKCQSGQLGGPKAQFVKSGFVEPEMVTALLEHVVVEVACGSNFNVCRTKKGKVFVFGSNQMSQLGLGGDEDEVYLPRELALTRFDDSGKVQVLQIDAGAQHSVAIVKVAK